MPHIMRNNSNYPKISLSHFSTEIVPSKEEKGESSMRADAESWTVA